MYASWSFTIHRYVPVTQEGLHTCMLRVASTILPPCPALWSSVQLGHKWLGYGPVQSQFSTGYFMSLKSDRSSFVCTVSPTFVIGCCPLSKSLPDHIMSCYIWQCATFRVNVFFVYINDLYWLACIKCTDILYYMYVHWCYSNSILGLFPGP